MKTKLVLIALFLTVMFSAAAKVQSYEAVAFSSNTYTNSKASWELVSIPVSVDLENKRVVIYSVERQIIDLGEGEKTVKNGDILYRFQATDSQYKQIFVSFLLTKSGDFSLIIEYSNYMYAYLLKDL